MAKAKAAEVRSEFLSKLLAQDRFRKLTDDWIKDNFIEVVTDIKTSEGPWSGTEVADDQDRAWMEELVDGMSEEQKKEIVRLVEEIEIFLTNELLSDLANK